MIEPYFLSGLFFVNLIRDSFIKCHKIMKNRFLSYIVLAISLFSLPAFSQTEETDDNLLGLPGDNLDLFAVLDLFQESPSIEDFEKSLNLEETGINNLDLDLDGKVDFIKVVTEQDGDDFSFILQVDVSETEIQDVAVILLSKDKDGDVTLQMVGDKDLYGKNYVIEPAPPTPAVTANPAYTGTEPVTSTPATTVVVVESAPVVQYVYSPVYVPYYPPYTYAYHPPYFAAAAVIAVGVYRHNHYYHYGGYHGGYHGNTVVVHNHNTYNNYNNNRNSSREVERNNADGRYSNRSPESRSSTSTADRQQRASTEGSRSSASTADRQQRASTEGSRSSASTADRQQRASTEGSRSSASPSASQSRGSSPSSSQSRGYSQSRSMGSSPSRSAGASRPSGGGGGGRRR